MSSKTKAELLSKLETNEAAKSAQLAVLKTEIDKWNADIRADKLPSNKTKISEELAPMHKYAQWCNALTVLVNEAERLKVEELTEEQVKVALVKARRFSDYSIKTDSETQIMSINTKQVSFDIGAILKKLDIDTGWKYDITLLAVTTTYTIARELGTTVENLIADAKMKDAHRQRMQDEKVMEKLAAGAKLESTRQIEKAYQDVLNAFLPGLDYKATKEDSTWFMLGSTTRDRKELGKIKIASGKAFEELIFDSLSLKFRNSSYSVSYKTKKAEPDEVPEDPKTEESKSGEPKPEEAPKTEEPKSEASAAEPVAAKPAKEPKSKKEPTSKRGSKGSKKSDKTAA